MTTNKKIENFLKAWAELGDDVDITFEDGVTHTKDDIFELCWNRPELNVTETFNPQDYSIE